MQNLNILGEYAYNLCQSQGYDEAFGYYTQLTEILGYDAVSYAYIPRPLGSVSHCLKAVSSNVFPNDFIVYFL